MNDMRGMGYCETRDAKMRAGDSARGWERTPANQDAGVRIELSPHSAARIAAMEKGTNNKKRFARSMIVSVSLYCSCNLWHVLF